MKAPGRDEQGVIWEQLRVVDPDGDFRFNARVLGPDDTDDDIVCLSFTANLGLDISLRIPRKDSRRIGELLIAAADDNPADHVPGAPEGAAL